MCKGTLGTGSEEIEGLFCDGFFSEQNKTVRMYLINLMLAVEIFKQYY